MIEIITKETLQARLDELTTHCEDCKHYGKEHCVLCALHTDIYQVEYEPKMAIGKD